MRVEYKPSWKSYYKDILVMLLLVILAGVAQYVKSGASWLKFVWIIVAVVDVLILLSIMMRRAMMSLILKDYPNDPANQEVEFIKKNPFKPFSSDFRRSIEIGLSNIVHIEVTQTMMQDMFGVGDVIITSSGTGGEEIHAKNIPSPAKVRDEIQTCAEKYKLR